MGALQQTHRHSGPLSQVGKNPTDARLPFPRWEDATPTQLLARSSPAWAQRPDCSPGLQSPGMMPSWPQVTALWEREWERYPGCGSLAGGSSSAWVRPQLATAATEGHPGQACISLGIQVVRPGPGHRTPHMLCFIRR